MNAQARRSTVVSVFADKDVDAVKTLKDILATDPNAKGDFSTSTLDDAHTVEIHVNVLPGDEQRVRMLAAHVRATIRQRGSDPNGSIIRIHITDQLTNATY
jgi:hypothetical protein